MKLKLCILSLLSALSIQTFFAQSNITIDHQTQRFINDVSTLDRTKYIHAYLTIRGNDPKFTALKEEYNFHPDYIGGRGLSNPASKLKSNTMPSVKNTYSGVRKVDEWYVTGGRPSDLFWDNNVDYSNTNTDNYSQNLANYVAKSLKSEWANLGKYFEPMNEPMVHAKDFYPSNYSTDKNDIIITKICEYHDQVGKAIHATPELANVEVMGYASAYPEFESGNFTLWEKRYKKFIDIAGEEMDLFSIHLYDGSGLNNTSGRRSGSNAEALLDIIEAYSYIKLGEVKPLAVSEYGRLVPNQPGWEAGKGISNYDDATNAQAVRSQLHLVMNFMERGDHFALGIPFNTNRGDDPTYQYAKASLWKKEADGSIVLSMRKYFYEMMKDLKGERVRINSEDIDVQTQAFVDGKELHVMLNNLSDDTKTMNLNLINSDGLQRVDIKKLYIPVDELPQFSESSTTDAPQSVELKYGETVVLKYHFDAPITFNNKIVSKKYYAEEYLQEIKSRTALSFNFKEVKTGNGLATLRIGVGREHGLSLTPYILVNGTSITVPHDAIRGYDQKNRSQFFGVLEIPFDISLLKDGDNKVDITFPGTGGKISSVILQVQKADKPLAAHLKKKSISSTLNLYPNPVNAGQSVFFTNNTETTDFYLTSLSGRKIYTGKGKQLNTQGMESGTYLLGIKENEKTHWQRLIIK